MNRLVQHGYVEALLGQGWTTEQIEETYAHRKDSQKYGLWRAMIRVMTLRAYSDDEIRRDKLMAIYGHLASAFLKLRVESDG